MSWDLDRRSLVEACRLVRPALGTDLPIHQGIRIEFLDGELRIGASNSVMAIRTQVRAPDVAQGPALVVPGMVLTRFVESSEGDTLSLSMINGQMVIEAPGGRLRLVPFADELWPRPEVIEADAVTIADGDALQISRVLFAVASAGQVPSLMGVHLSSGKATATDKQRLAQAPFDADVASMIVPTGFLRVMLRDRGDQPVSIRVGHRRVGFATSDTAWESQTIPPPYPNVAPLLAQRASARLLEFDRALLARALEQLGVFGAADSHVQVTVAGANCELRVEHAEYGESLQEIEIGGSWSGEIWFNLSHLNDAVAASSAQMTVLAIDEPDKPVILRDPELVQVLMPRVRST